VRHLRNGKEADQSLVCGVRSGRRAAGERVEVAEPAASGTKHLCGQTCLHKLVDEFMARDLAARVQPGAADESEVECRRRRPMPA